MDTAGEMYAKALVEGAVSVEPAQAARITELARNTISKLNSFAKAEDIPPRILLATVAGEIGAAIGFDTIRSIAVEGVSDADKFNEGWAGLALFVEAMRQLAGPHMLNAYLDQQADDAEAA